jgi:hypothetical protein
MLLIIEELAIYYIKYTGLLEEELGRACRQQGRSSLNKSSALSLL